MPALSVCGMYGLVKVRVCTGWYGWLGLQYTYNYQFFWISSSSRELWDWVLGVCSRPSLQRVPWRNLNLQERKIRLCGEIIQWRLRKERKSQVKMDRWSWHSSLWFLWLLQGGDDRHQQHCGRYVLWWTQLCLWREYSLKDSPYDKV